MKYGIFQKSMDDGNSILLDNYVVQIAGCLFNPYECPETVFEGTLEECRNYCEMED